MRSFLIQLLKDHDVPGYRTHNAWSKDAWTSIASQLNNRFSLLYTVNQVKQKKQDLKKEYRSVKDLLAGSGFGWDSERMMVDAPESVWATFAARKNSKEPLQWKDKSYPYFDELSALYDGRYAEGRTRRGMDYYASKTHDAFISIDESTDAYHSPLPNLQGPGEPGLDLFDKKETEDTNLDVAHRSSTPMQHMKSTPTCKQPCPEKPSKCAKRQKTSPTEPTDGFHERYLQLKQEEINRFAAIEERKLHDPYSINKCITTLEGLDGLQTSDILMASDIFQSTNNREVFLSYSSDALKLAWIRREIARSNPNY
ncbi:uncharacterized protein LOC102702962 [Oryza brachyantha]|uniref:uncharacterized protein LOC102702962 n=1 Tax=Oryza brachyantha TaxID=4533 RepID=UPI001ADCAC48|nr:uncharacterized protein LOC102702962 [Oryza brachyantha]XP_040382822.1 uncharacterized protein LOC102702962 [Oryza brachyantha]